MTLKVIFRLTILLCTLLSMPCFSAAVAVPPTKAALCTACHGAQGNSANPQWPNLAGQHSSYLKKQLLDFKKGKTRTAPTMAAIVAGLTDKDIDELAVYYASLPRATGSVPAKYLKHGEALYRGGDLDKHITACIACHGPNGLGNNEAGFPVLSGQHAPYIQEELEAFKNKARLNDYNAIMRDISARMDKDDIEAVAFYIQGLY
jgi:cytochrome c553